MIALTVKNITATKFYGRNAFDGVLRETSAINLLLFQSETLVKEDDIRKGIWELRGIARAVHKKAVRQLEFLSICNSTSERKSHLI
jgi:hypothetical protein